jgi:hypothetical protein
MREVITQDLGFIFSYWLLNHWLLFGYWDLEIDYSRFGYYLTQIFQHFKSQKKEVRNVEDSGHHQ